MDTESYRQRPGLSLGKDKVCLNYFCNKFGKRKKQTISNRIYGNIELLLKQKRNKRFSRPFSLAALTPCPLSDEYVSSIYLFKALRVGGNRKLYEKNHRKAGYKKARRPNLRKSFIFWSRFLRCKTDEKEFGNLPSMWFCVVGMRAAYYHFLADNLSLSLLPARTAVALDITLTVWPPRLG